MAMLPEVPLISPKTVKPQKQKDSIIIGFRYVWPVRVSPRQLGPNGENTILHISPKFSTVHEHISFQWTMKMYGTPEMGESDEDETTKYREDEGEETDDVIKKGYVAISLYYLDGPMSTVNLKAQVRIAGERRDPDEKQQKLLEEVDTLSVFRGHECELSFRDRAHLTDYIRQKIGLPIRLSLMLEMDAHFFRTDSYLNAVSPTPYHSFLTANYRARIGSKVWGKRSNRKYRARSASDGHSLVAGHRKLDLERVFNRVMEQERGRSPSAGQQTNLEEAIADNSRKSVDVDQEPNGSSPSADGVLAFPPPNCRQCKQPNHPPPCAVPSGPSGMFKKLLIACCDSCERRASLITISIMPADGGTSIDDEDWGRSGVAEEDGEEEDEDEETSFECDEANKTEVHDALANMYFNTVVLTDLEYVEDFVDFLIDAELSDLPVLKRACERYLCGELDSKKELMTSLILDFFFIAMVFSLPVMKSMTLTELCERYSELEDVDKLLEQEEYRNIDKRIRQICGERNLHDLVDECKRFREQCTRVQKLDLNNNDRNVQKRSNKLGSKEESDGEAKLLKTQMNFNLDR
uniref:BTB domain-containing protein n=1 Tax=Globodera rostochiensis TaxID=31243 RepID=A0A914H1J3_GLORO